MLTQDPASFRYPPTDAYGTALSLDAYSAALDAYSATVQSPATLRALINAAQEYIESAPIIIVRGDIPRITQTSLDRFNDALAHASLAYAEVAPPDLDLARHVLRASLQYLARAFLTNGRTGNVTAAAHNVLTACADLPPSVIRAEVAAAGLDSELHPV